MSFSPTIQSANSEQKIFDAVRKKYVALTPEELVRQGFINFLVADRGFPQALLMVEYALKVNGLSRRCDVVACNRAGAPLLLVECKAPGVKIGNETFAQAARYNLTLRVPYLAITNGDNTYCCRVNFETEKV
ncbi:MAG: type I restriction enzyme HsdR N-terminal domain-containing protein, partial [Prevotellaceae bacterium]|nr:type I restriction enzyme HsdR N-terminal domain-containing protein [Prevotellaceae bacterium]